MSQGSRNGTTKHFQTTKILCVLLKLVERNLVGETEPHDVESFSQNLQLAREAILDWYSRFRTEPGFDRDVDSIDQFLADLTDQLSQVTELSNSEDKVESSQIGSCFMRFRSQLIETRKELKRQMDMCRVGNPACSSPESLSGPTE